MGSKSDWKSMKEEHTNFTWSKPVGYDFQEVDETICQYKATISDVNELLIQKDNIIRQQAGQIDDYIAQITQLQQEMLAVTSPSMEAEEALNIINNFAENNTESIKVVTIPEAESSTQQVNGVQEFTDTVSVEAEEAISNNVVQKPANKNEFNLDNLNVIE